MMKYETLATLIAAPRPPADDRDPTAFAHWVRNLRADRPPLHPDGKRSRTVRSIRSSAGTKRHRLRSGHHSGGQMVVAAEKGEDAMTYAYFNLERRREIAAHYEKHRESFGKRSVSSVRACVLGTTSRKSAPAPTVAAAIRTM